MIALAYPIWKEPMKLAVFTVSVPEWSPKRP
jgi:hypothetical protein